MNLFAKIGRAFGLGTHSVPKSESRVLDRRQIQARFDAAQTTDENSRHWSMVDGLSARSANSPIVRKRLRDRVRYEVSNNPMAEGMISSFANDVIATGPRLQLNTGNDDFDDFVREAWCRWAKATRFTSKLRINVRSKIQDGEAFNQLVTNDRLPTQVKLDVRPFEAEMCTTPTENLADPFRIDGINYDRQGNPIEYRILKRHPGDMGPNFWEGDWVNARYVSHWFKISRPGQVRGVPEIHSALALFATRRRFMLATLQAAETAASFGGVIETETPPGEADTTDPLSTVDLDRNTFMTLPSGNKLHQVTAEHPNSTFSEFNRDITRETGRPLGQPYNVTAGDSSDHNYASGRLDHQGYWNVIDISRSECEDVVISPVFVAWFSEFRLTEEWSVWMAEHGQDELAGPIESIDDILDGEAVGWEWDGHPHVDPVKEANASETNIENGLTSTESEASASGRNARHEQEKEARFLGCTIEQLQRGQRVKRFGFDPSDPNSLPPGSPQQQQANPAAPKARASSKPTEPDEPVKPKRLPMPAGRGRA